MFLNYIIHTLQVIVNSYRRKKELMCSICKSLVCPTACPNYEGEYTYDCKLCHRGIERGEHYYEIRGVHYHEECLLNYYSSREALSLAGINPSTFGIPRFSAYVVGIRNGK